MDPQLMNLPGHISECTRPILIKFLALDSKVFWSSHSQFHWNETRIRVCFLPLHPACLFGEKRYLKGQNTVLHHLLHFQRQIPQSRTLDYATYPLVMCFNKCALTCTCMHAYAHACVHVHKPTTYTFSHTHYVICEPNPWFIVYYH